MTYTLADTMPAPEEAPKPRRPWLIPVVAAVAVLAVGAGIYAFLREDNAPAQQPPAAAAAQVFAFHGKLTINDDPLPITEFRPLGGSCSGTGGYKDIREGAQVVITDANGKMVATDRLSGGQLVGWSYSPTDRGVCQWSIVVQNLPAGQGPYSVEVSHRGKLSFTEAEVTTESLEMTLG